MKRILLIGLYIFFGLVGYGQYISGNKCPYKGTQVPSSLNRGVVGDFTIISTNGDTLNLYNTLDEGKTVFIDLFFTTCGYCQSYAPIIENIYQNTGSGQDNIVFWGISSDNYDSDPIIETYKSNFGVSNPCAGPQGGGISAHNTVVAGQEFPGLADLLRHLPQSQHVLRSRLPSDTYRI